MTGLHALLLAGMLLAAAPPAVPPADLEAQAKAIENKLMAPCCMSNTVAVHESGIAHQMRREIRESLAAGRSEREILDGYVEQYGEQILALPRASGFNLTAYLLPMGLLFAGAGALALALRRWRATPAAAAAPLPAPPDAAGAARLREELRRLG